MRAALEKLRLNCLTLEEAREAADELKRTWLAEGELKVAEEGLKSQVQSLRARNAELVEMLKFYADPPEVDENGEMVYVPDFYDEMDFGDRARAAVAKEDTDPIYDESGFQIGTASKRKDR